MAIMTRKRGADLVIVGAGSAGAVIAARATERGDQDVLLLEAGPDYPTVEATPGDLRDGSHNSMRAHDWRLRHRPNPRQFTLHFPRGRVVGGSSAVNTCIALRGQPYDYDEWGARGLADWSWAQCLPAFKRLENDLDVRNEWHSQDGPVPIRRHPPEELVPWQAAFVEACRGFGWPACADTNDPTTSGVGPHAMNKVGGERMSAARCYLTPEVRARESLRIRPHTLVRRVLFRNRRVVGLEVETDGRVHELATGKVILSGGAVATPGILLRSGIGPRREVQRLGVELVYDVPAVGAKLLDHPGAAVFFRPRLGVMSSEHPIVQTVLRFTSKASTQPNDMQLQPGSFIPLPSFSLPFVTIACCVGKPRGHGRIHFPDANPRSRPRIDSRLFVDPHDRACAIEAMQLAHRCVTAGAMGKLASPIWPSAKVVADSARLDAFLWRMCDSGYHPCGTVPMGRDGDREAACDGRGRVRGVHGLWVADASLMPTIPSANTNLATLMIGERFGEWARDGGL
jgi:choline dehydrogenase